MLQCNDIRALLPDYAAGKLEEHTAVQVAEHLLTCPVCAGALERLEQAACHAPAPAAEVRGFETKDPLAGEKAAVAKVQTPATAAEDPADKQESAAKETTELIPKRKLRRRTKVLIALAALLAVACVCVGILHSREFFAIRGWEKTDDGSFAAVIYAGAESGEKDGFRVRLWNGTKKEWHDEVAFYDATYRKTVWSPNGRFAAVEFTDTEGHDRVYIIDINRLTSADLQTVLEGYLQRNDGYFDKTPLVIAPSCRILQWLPDSNRLLIAAEGTVDTNIDPDYGIELASDWSLSVNNGAQINIVIINGKAQTVSGYFAYEVDFFDIENIVGFGKRNGETQLTALQAIADEFRSTGAMVSPPGSNEAYCEEVYYQTEALTELAKLPDFCRMEGISYRLAVMSNLNFTYESWSSLRTKLTADSGVILFTNAQRTVAYVIVIP